MTLRKWLSALLAVCVLSAMIPAAEAEAVASEASPVEDAVEEVTVELGGDEVYELNGTEAGLFAEEEGTLAINDDPQSDANFVRNSEPREWWDPDTGFYYTVTGDGVLNGIYWYDSDPNAIVISKGLSVAADLVTPEALTIPAKLPTDPAVKVTALDGEGEMLLRGITSDPNISLNDYIKTIVIEEGPTQITARTFADSTALTSLKLPATLLSIDQYAFKNANPALKTAIPNGVKLEAAAFEGVSDGTFTFAGASNVIGDGAIPGTATIYCPYVSDANTYATANGMKNVFFTDVFTATIAGDTVEGGVQAFYETGSAVRPAVTAKLKDGTALSADDFTVSYPDAVAVGDYELTVAGGKRFPAEANTQTIPFKIIAAPAEELTVELSPH